MSDSLSYRHRNGWDRMAAEKRILGWCLERGRVPSVVREMDPDALSAGLSRFLWGLLMELEGRGVTWGPVDLVLWSMEERAESEDEVEPEIANMLTFYRQEIIALPLLAGWDQDLADDVGYLEAEWMISECRRMDAEERADNLERLDAEVCAVRLWQLMGEPKGTAAVPLDGLRIHPAWLPYLKADLQEAA